MEYKFRGLRKDGEGWAYGDLIQDPTSDQKHIREYKDVQTEAGLHEIVESEHDVIPETVGQLKLILKGTEVYEGDQLEHWEDSEYPLEKRKVRKVDTIVNKGYNKHTHLWSFHEYKLYGNIHQLTLNE